MSTSSGCFHDLRWGASGAHASAQTPVRHFGAPRQQAAIFSCSSGEACLFALSFPTHMYTRLLHLRHASIDTKPSTLVPGIVNNNIFASSRPYPRRKEHVFAGVSTPSTTPTPGALAYLAH